MQVHTQTHTRKLLTSLCNSIHTPTNCYFQQHKLVCSSKTGTNSLQTSHSARGMFERFAGDVLVIVNASADGDDGDQMLIYINP